MSDDLGPYLINLDPPEGSNLSAGSAVSFDVIDELDGVFYSSVEADQVSRREVIFDGDSFLYPYLESTRAAITGGYRYTIRRSGGWRSAPRFYVRAFDPGINAESGIAKLAFDFTHAPRTAGVYTLPAWLSISCPTAGRTSQQSASSLLSGFGANAARARSVDGVNFGLSVESARTYWNRNNRVGTGSGWAGSALPFASEPGPGGDLGAFSVSAISGGFSAGYQSITALSGPKAFNVISAYVKRANGAGPGPAQFAGNNDTSLPYKSVWSESSLTDVAWKRVSVAYSYALLSSGIQYLIPADGRDQTASPSGGIAAGSRAFLLDWLCLETGQYPSSAFATGSTQPTRAADILKAPGSYLSPDGYFDIALTYAPHYSETEAILEHTLIYFDANNKLTYQPSSSQFILTVNGDTLTSDDGLTFPRNGPITIRATHKANGRSLSVLGLSSVASAAPPITVPAFAGILGTPSAGAEEGADLRRIVVYR